MALNYRTARGWLRPEEREYLHRISAMAGQTGIIVNIGVEHGASLVCFRSGNPECRIYGLDLDVSKAPNNLAVIFLRGDSGVHVRYTDQWLPDPISVLFVDGDHEYDGVVRDIEYTELVSHGGVVIFHDCYDFNNPLIVHQVCPGVNQAVTEWYDTKKESDDRWVELDSVGTMRIFRRGDV